MGLDKRRRRKIRDNKLRTKRQLKRSQKQKVDKWLHKFQNGEDVFPEDKLFDDDDYPDGLN